MREIPNNSQDKLVADQKLFDDLCQLFKTLHDYELKHKFHIKNTELDSSQYTSICPDGYRKVMRDTLGFDLIRSTSSLSGAGMGVFVTNGCILEKSLVALYPGMCKTKA